MFKLFSRTFFACACVYVYISFLYSWSFIFSLLPWLPDGTISYTFSSGCLESVLSPFFSGFQWTVSVLACLVSWLLDLQYSYMLLFVVMLSEISRIFFSRVLNIRLNEQLVFDKLICIIRHFGFPIYFSAFDLRLW